jgi:hypothetical protein
MKDKYSYLNRYVSKLNYWLNYILVAHVSFTSLWHTSVLTDRSQNDSDKETVQLHCQLSGKLKTLRRSSFITLKGIMPYWKPDNTDSLRKQE